MLPTGVLALVRLNTLLMFIEKESVQGSLNRAGLAGGCVEPASVVRGAPGGGVLGSIAGPNLNAFPRLKLRRRTWSTSDVSRDDRLSGRRCWIESANGVITTPGSLRSVANAGRSVKARIAVRILSGGDIERLAEARMPNELKVILNGAV